MKNRVLGMAVAVAALAGASAQMATPQSAGYTAPTRVAGGSQAPQGGISTMLGSIADARGDAGGVGGGVRPKYMRPGTTVAAAQRRARKRRNVLRSKGHHRKAVR